MVEYDQRYEHYGVPQPQLLALAAPARRPPGLTDPVVLRHAPAQRLDRTRPSTSRTWPSRATSAGPRHSSTYTVANPRPMLRGESDSGAIVMEGDATGLNNLAGLGSAQHRQRHLLRGHPGQRRGAAAQLSSAGAQLVVTDTNRKQAFRWDTLTANVGYTETPSENPAKTDQSDSPVELFPGSTITSKTVRHLRRRRQRLGQQLRQLGLVHARGPGLQRHRRQLRHGLDHGHVRPRPGGPVVAGPIRPTRSRPTTSRWCSPSAATVRRWVSAVTLTFDGKDPIRYNLTNGVAPDERPDAVLPDAHLPHPARHARRHDGQHRHRRSRPPPSGFSEIEIPGQSVHQVLQMPTQMLSSPGRAPRRRTD